VRVHKLRTVAREQVILPEKTLQLLERNVSEFIAHRQQLKDLGMSTKKGLLFHGPPGTGKTHTIHYLASQLPDHTTLLITAQEVGLLDEYMQLARFLQPAMIVLEDVDLIARSRTSMRNPCEEGLLNKLLNEMDGLREDAELLFVLTTNRPEELENALASRPGRVDQAIEFPLPDATGRRKLILLYAGQLEIPDKVATAIVKKTQGASAAFIKELMRRSAQSMIRSGETKVLHSKHVEGALDEMLFTGSSLNTKLLGGARKEV
jgi:ATP-dependent 26S proteasome regulatory subunit